MLYGPDAELQAVFDLRRFLTEEQERTALAYGLRAIIETKLYDKAKDFWNDMVEVEKDGKTFYFDREGTAV